MDFTPTLSELTPKKAPFSFHLLTVMFSELSYGRFSPDVLFVGLGIYDKFFKLEGWVHGPHTFNGADVIAIPKLPLFGVAMVCCSMLNDPRYNRTQEFEAS